MHFTNRQANANKMFEREDCVHAPFILSCDFVKQTE